MCACPKPVALRCQEVELSLCRSWSLLQGCLLAAVRALKEVLGGAVLRCGRQSGVRCPVSGSGRVPTAAVGSGGTAGAGTGPSLRPLADGSGLTVRRRLPPTGPVSAGQSASRHGPVSSPRTGRHQLSKHARRPHAAGQCLLSQHPRETTAGEMYVQTSHERVGPHPRQTRTDLCRADPHGPFHPHGIQPSADGGRITIPFRICAFIMVYTIGTSANRKNLRDLESIEE